MSAAFAIVFLTVCTFIYAQDKDPVKPGPRAFVYRVGLCLFVAACIYGMAEALGLFHLSGIDPNEGQHM